MIRAFATTLLLFAAAGAHADVALPAFEGPITSPGSAFIQASGADLTVGYLQDEYFVSGTATAYTNTAPLGPDGRWSVAPGELAPYKTRIVVHRPTSAKKFNGSVVVEWLNVSGGVDAGPDWTFMHNELIRRGYVWVGVSAQIVGVEPGHPALVGVISLPLKSVDPARYGSLHHPGDSFSYDMFSQAGHLVRQTGGPLGDLAGKVKRVIPVGESQSAFRMVTYIDAIHPVAKVFDGFFVHSRAGFLGGALSEAPQPAIGVPGAAIIRTDVDVPVLIFETESDLTFLQYFNARQDDGTNIRVWEVAGTSHADLYTVVQGATDRGKDPSVVAPAEVSSPLPGIIECDAPINSGPQHFVLSAAISALEHWVRKGKAPKSAPRLDVSAGPPIAINHDAHGNALGGVRTPQVDVPIATFTGQQPGSILCQLFGTTTLFDPATLAQLYPKHRAFVSAYKRALKRSVKAGWILPPDAKLIKKWAVTATIGS